MKDFQIFHKSSAEMRKTMNESLRTELPKLALDDIPTPTENAVRIIGLVKHHGRIEGYQLSDDRIVSRSEGVSLARSG